MSVTRTIFCCECECGCDVVARLTDGAEVYPHRPDLHGLPFWKCDDCKLYVGCHHKTKQPTKPLGVIPNQAIRNARQHLHRLIDPLWQSGKIGRGHLYSRISAVIGYQYHTAEIRTLDDARKIYVVVQGIQKEISPPW